MQERGSSWDRMWRGEGACGKGVGRKSWLIDWYTYKQTYIPTIFSWIYWRKPFQLQHRQSCAILWSFCFSCCSGTCICICIPELKEPSSTVYRVAAIFPERFQCFTVALKNNLFYNFFPAKPSQLSAKTWKNKQSHSGKDESTGRQRSRDSLWTLRQTYHDRD